MSEENFGAAAELVPVRAVLAEDGRQPGAVLVMRDGSFRMILQTGAINFDMKSPVEQGGLTHAFGALVDSLEVDFSIEIVSHSKLLDTDAYIRQFQPRLDNEFTPPQIKRMIADHTAHFEQSVKQNKLLQRELYVVIPWKGTSGPYQKSHLDDIPGASLFKSIARNVEQKVSDFKPSDMDIATARQQLDLRSDQLIGYFSRMGIWARRLNEDQIRRLLYQLYHPSRAERQPDPGYGHGGLVSGFSSEGIVNPRRRDDGGEIGPANFDVN